MKVIIYQDQKKITVGNIAIPNFVQLKEDLAEKFSEVSWEELQRYHLQITSIRGIASDYTKYDKTMEKEIAEGINWQQETVN